MVRRPADASSTEAPKLGGPTTEIPLEHIVFGSIIKSGDWGVVSKASYLGATVAAKMIKASGKNEQLRKATIQKEVELHKRIRCPNVVQFIGVCHSPDHTWIITEYIEGPDLENFIFSSRYLGNHKAANKEALALDIVKGLAYIHIKANSSYTRMSSQPILS